MSHDAQGQFKSISQEEEEEELTKATRFDLIYKHALAKKSQSSEKTIKMSESREWSGRKTCGGVSGNQHGNLEMVYRFTEDVARCNAESH